MLVSEIILPCLDPWSNKIQIRSWTCRSRYDGNRPLGRVDSSCDTDMEWHKL